MTLTTALKETNWIVAEEAAERLGNLGNPKAIESLAAALDWEGFRASDVHIAAAAALYKLSDGRGLNFLTECLRADNHIAAAAALYKLGDARGLSHLTKCLRADSLYVRVDARKALQELGAFPKA